MMSLAAPKGSKCPCGKRATGTMMSRDGQRSLLPVCAKCGLVAMHIMKALDDDAASPPKTTDEHKELRQWMTTSGGQSAYTLVFWLVPELREFAAGRHGSPRPDSYPYDPSDFNRCHKALKLIPGGVERLAEVAKELGGVWAQLAPAWAELTALLEVELKNKNGAAPKLYARMEQLRVKGGER